MAVEPGMEDDFSRPKLPKIKGKTYQSHFPYKMKQMMDKVVEREEREPAEILRDAFLEYYSKTIQS